MTSTQEKNSGIKKQFTLRRDFVRTCIATSIAPLLTLPLIIFCLLLLGIISNPRVLLLTRGIDHFIADINSGVAAAIIIWLWLFWDFFLKLFYITFPALAVLNYIYFSTHNSYSKKIDWMKLILFISISYLVVLALAYGLSGSPRFTFI